MRTVIEKAHPSGFGGTQKLFRFDNEFGASVIKFPYSHGYDEGLWELAVIHYEKKDKDKYVIVYDTPITDDVIGRLRDSEIDNLLKQIEALPAMV